VVELGSLLGSEEGTPVVVVVGELVGAVVVGSAPVGVAETGANDTGMKGIM